MPLTAGEASSPFADRGLVALRKGHDEVVDLRGSGRGLDLAIGRAGPGEANVLADRRVEQHRLLRDDPDLGEERLMRDLPEVPAVDRHRALLRIIGPRNQVKDRALARSVAAHQRDEVADGNAQGHVIEVALLAAVAEADAVEEDLCGQAGRGHSMRGVADVDRLIE